MRSEKMYPHKRVNQLLSKAHQHAANADLDAIRHIFKLLGKQLKPEKRTAILNKYNTVATEKANASK